MQILQLSLRTIDNCWDRHVVARSSTANNWRQRMFRTCWKNSGDCLKYRWHYLSHSILITITVMVPSHHLRNPLPSDICWRRRNHKRILRCCRHFVMAYIVAAHYGSVLLPH